MQVSNQEKERRLDTILDGQDPDMTALDTYASTEALTAASDAQLEQLLLEDEAMRQESNDQLRDQVIGILAQRNGTDYVAELFQRAKMGETVWQLWPAGDAQKHLDHETHTPADRAREAFKEHDLLIWQLIPDNLTHFQIDENGVWSMYLDEPELVHMPHFDVLLDDEMSGMMEVDKTWNVRGIQAISTVAGTSVNVDLVEFHSIRGEMVITTNSPLAPVIHVDPNDFLQVIFP